jgi:hypothetical protein
MTELEPATQVQWRRFLSSDAGIKGMLYLRQMTPGITKGAPHEMHHDGGVNQGYTRCLDKIEGIGNGKSTRDIKIENE